MPQKKADKLKAWVLVPSDGRYLNDDEQPDPNGKTAIFPLANALRFNSDKTAKDILAGVRHPDGSQDLRRGAGRRDGAVSAAPSRPSLRSTSPNTPRTRRGGPATPTRSTPTPRPAGAHARGREGPAGLAVPVPAEPAAIRPLAVLRMPKFSLGDEDAMSLVNYFAAVTSGPTRTSV